MMSNRRSIRNIRDPATDPTLSDIHLFLTVGNDFRYIQSGDPFDPETYVYQKHVSYTDESLQDFLCTTNDRVTVTIRVHQFVMIINEKIPTSLDVEICLANSKDKWTQLKMYGLSKEVVFEDLNNIIDKLIESWKVMYNV